MDYLKELNSEQIVAVAAVDGYIRVIAGAGSGKTRALTTRYAYLLDAVGVSPDKILCVTFTNKAANAMKDRVRHIIGEEIELKHIQTFHSFCNYFLRSEIHNLGFRKGYKILDEGDQKTLARSIFDLLELNSTDFMTVEAFLDNVMTPEVKCSEDFEKYIEYLTSKSVSDMWRDLPEEETTKEMAVKAYLTEQKSNNCLDYDDLINFTLYLLRTNKEVRERWQNKFDYIQIDEFQDVNEKELEIVALLSAKKGNLFVVGDPDQCLYTFRGADVHCIVNFDKLISKVLGKSITCVTLYLNTNYRSVPEITKMANSLIRHNTVRLDKDLRPVKDHGVMTEHRLLGSYEDEANYIVNIIRKNRIEGIPYRDIAVLYRVNFLSRNIEKKLVEAGIPYTIVKGVSFYARKEIKNIMAILSLVCYGDDLSLIRLLKEIRMGIGAKGILNLQFLANNDNSSMFEALVRHKYEKGFKKSHEFIDSIFKLRNIYERYNKSRPYLYDLVLELCNLFKFEAMYVKEPERLDNISELFVAIREYENKYQGEERTLEDYLEEVSLFTAVEDSTDDEKTDKVQLMTVHASKGLEFPVVIVAGMNQGILPYVKALGNDLAIEEERRISYVAMTRAENKLYLTSSRSYDFKGNFQPVSQFIYEIPSSFFKSNVNSKTTVEYDLAELIKSFSPQLKVAIGHLSDSQLEHYMKTHRLLTHYSTYYDACEFTDEFELKLLQFMRTLSDSAFDAWFDTITEETYKEIFKGNFGDTNASLTSDEAVNVLLGDF